LILPVFLGGLFIGVLSALPIISIANCCCLWLISGGVLTVRLAQQDRPFINPGRGALLGLGAGVVGAVVWVFAAVALDVVLGPLQRQMIEAMLSGAQDMPPDAREWFEQIAATSASPLRYVMGFAFHFFGAAFAALGGFLGAMFFRRDVPPALGGDPLVPPPLPPE
jgi:hypothetical protein